MEFGSKNKKQKLDEHCYTRDWLTELPDEILLHILSFLPTRDAVRTMSLRCFGNLWTLLKTFVFDVDQFCGGKFILNVLKYNKCLTIDKLDYFMAHGLYKHLIKSIKIALRKEAKVLRIDGDEDPSYVVLPPRVFKNQYLVSLMITNFMIKLPSRVFMGSLRILELKHVDLSDVKFEKLISGCPCLEELIITYPDEFEELNITSPSIKKLKLNIKSEMRYSHDEYCCSIDCPNLKTLHIEQALVENMEFIDVSSVREVSFTYCGLTEHFEMLLKTFQNAEVRRFGDRAYLQLGHCGNVKNFPLANLKSLMALRSGVRGSCLLGICRLLRNSQCLEDLIIYADVVFVCKCNMLLHELTSPCVIRQLKKVTIHDYGKLCEELLQLIEFLLKSAVVLEEVVIFCNRKDEFRMALLRFPRASQNARVEFA